MLRGESPAAALSPRYSVTELPPAVVRLIGRYYFGTTCLAALLIALMLLLPEGPAPPWRPALLAALGLYAAGCVWALRTGLHQRRRMDLALFVAGAAGMALVSVTALAFGDGLRHPLLGLFGLVVCMLSGVGGTRLGAALGAFCLAQLLLLGGAESAGWTQAPVPGTPLPAALLFQCLAIASGVAGGTLLSRMLMHYLEIAAQREERFRNLMALAADWYWEQDEQFRFTHVSANPASGSLVDDEQRLGQTPWEISGLGLTEAELAAHRADLEAHRPFAGLLVRRRDRRGRERFLSISGEPKFDVQGVFRGYWGVGRDVSDEVRAQRATAASESRYRELFRRSPTPLMLHRNGIVFDANEAAARLFGFDDPAAMAGFDLREAYVDPDSLARVQQRIAMLESLAPGEGLPLDNFRMVSKRGRQLTVQATAARVEMDDGSASLSLYFDVTDRVAAEAALRRSQALLSHLIDTSPDCITLSEMATGRYELVNESFERVFGYAAAEVVGRTSIEIGIWHDLADRARLVDTIRDKGRADDVQALIRAKSGRLVPMQLSAARFDMDGRDYLVITGRDLSESERERLEHDAILKNASIGIAFSRDGLFQHTNPSFDRMFGWETGRLAGQPTTVIWPHRDDYDAMRSEAGPVLSRGQPYELEREMLHADGTRFWCRMRGQALEAGSPRSGGTIWIAEDVTERRLVDQALASARDAAEAASRAKSAFLANTSHEIRTPLNGLVGLARLAMQPGLDEPRRQQYLAQIFDSAHNLSAIISDILDLSKIEAGKIMLESVPFGLRDTLSAVHDAYRSLAEAKGLTLVLAVDQSVPAAVQGDPVRVRQILTNFVTNALKFTERGLVRIHAAAGGAGRVRFSVSDTGPGIDAATQQRLFMPFSQADDSTTRRYGGTGLGLSICRELAHMMGGDVGVQSVPGAGSTFWAELPLPETTVPDSEHGELDVPVERLHGARVLMVEDNLVNMLIAVAMLEQWGIEVVQATDGPMALDAVALAAQQGRPFDAVLMDVQMPRMSGHEVARDLRRRFDRHALPIIALTAAALVSERDEALASGMNDFLTKPIDAPRLKEALARAIAMHRRS
ncbi:PAS domain-containing hybrid sensor histidine kinase/response regulator [Piscinibacter sp.]|uniref:PAS domain-containing hybrid sensor histidine kinase/response regulator n=1 Tax=Piscinibacter sp. TaxID=1903157 RepID=UPI002C926E94|nr:PAS domain S-box protein [Albitalea sp.]HUG21572.1 PAS domain S-box protein [Albitalea sp.]